MGIFQRASKRCIQTLRRFNNQGIAVKKGDIRFILNKEKFIIAKVKVYDVTETHIRVQNVINNDVCPPIIPIPKTKEDILFGNYMEAKGAFGAFLYNQYSEIKKGSIVTMGEYGVEMDIVVINELIEYTRKFAPEKLI